jgi:hypothetical protein
LRRLFERYDRLMEQARAVEREIAREGRAYWDRQGLRALPRLERLRAEVGA